MGAFHDNHFVIFHTKKGHFIYLHITTCANFKIHSSMFQYKWCCVNCNS